MIVWLRKTVAPVPQTDPYGLRIRPHASDADAAAWLRLRQTAGPTPLPKPLPLQAFHHEFLQRPWWRSDRLLFAQWEGTSQNDTPEPVGTAALSQHGPRHFLSWLLVAPESRRRGVGAALVAHVEATAARLGAAELLVETDSSWTEATAFYRRIGFRDFSADDQSAMTETVTGDGADSRQAERRRDPSNERG